MFNQRVIGVDLAGSENRPTGLCFLRGKMVKTKLVYGDEEISKEVTEFKPSLVAIDAPLSFPKDMNSKYLVRRCDKELRKLGIRFFSINLAGMRRLTERGIRLKLEFERKGFEVIETYPGAFYDIMGLPRPKNSDLIERVLKSLIEKFEL